MHSRTLSLVLVCVAFFSAWGLAAAQGPDTLWHRTYGGTASDYGYALEITGDGGYVISGNTSSFGSGSSDFYLVRTDANGDTLWHRAYGGPNFDYGRGIRRTPDGGYVVVGSSDVSGAGDFDVYLVKTDANGDTMWTRCYGTPNGNDRGMDICRTADGGYFIAGYTNSFGHGGNDGYLIKTDSIGNVIWEKAHGWSASEYFERVALTADGGCILVGSTTSSTPPGWDVFVVRTNASGDSLWYTSWGGSGQDYGYCGIQTWDGGFIAVGTLETTSSSYQAYIIKMHADGSNQWRRYYGGYELEEAFCVRQTSPDSGYIVVGHSDSYGAGDWDVYLLRTNAAGDTLWTATYGDTLRDWGYQIELLHHDEYIISGSSRSYGGGDDDVYLIRTSSDPAEVHGTHAEVGGGLNFEVWPNPSTGEVNLAYTVLRCDEAKITVYDCQGRLICGLEGSPAGAGRWTSTWDGRDAEGHAMGPGIYFYKLRAGGRQATIKSVKLR